MDWGAVKKASGCLGCLFLKNLLRCAATCEEGIGTMKKNGEDAGIGSRLAPSVPTTPAAKLLPRSKLYFTSNVARALRRPSCASAPGGVAR